MQQLADQIYQLATLSPLTHAQLTQVLKDVQERLDAIPSVTIRDIPGQETMPI